MRPLSCSGPTLLPPFDRGVVAQARAAGVTGQETGLLGYEVDRFSGGPGDRVGRHGLGACEGGRRYRVSIATWCDSCRAPSRTGVVEAGCPDARDHLTYQWCATWGRLTLDDRSTTIAARAHPDANAKVAQAPIVVHSTPPIIDAKTRPILMTDCSSP